MVHIRFEKGCPDLQYKTRHDDKSFSHLNFLNGNCLKGGIGKPQAMVAPRGVVKERKEQLVKKLTGIIPPNRLQFWTSLPELDS